MAQSDFHSDAQPTSDRFRDSQRMRDMNMNHDDTTFEDPSIARERADERERAEAREAAREHADLMGREGSDHTSIGTSYLGGKSSDEALNEWRQIQADFVDNPQSAVAAAHGLVGNLIESIVRRFEDERNQLEQRWSSGQDVSTEDLRRCLQTYRDFFNRLLATNSSDAKV